MKKFIKGILTADVKKKLKSKVVWVSVAGIIAGMILYFVPGLSEPFKVIANGLIDIVALFGILNNPNDRDKF